MRTGDMIVSLMVDAGFNADVDVSAVTDAEKPKMLVAMCATMITDMLLIIARGDKETALTGVDMLTTDMKNNIVNRKKETMQ